MTRLKVPCGAVSSVILGPLVPQPILGCPGPWDVSDAFCSRSSRLILQSLYWVQSLQQEAGTLGAVSWELVCLSLMCLAMRTSGQGHS